jgi:hypothetical protein
MAKSYQRSLLIGLITLAPLFGACEQADISGVTEQPTASVAYKGGKQAKVLKKKARSPKTTVDSDVATHGKGLELKIGKFELWVPKGAVRTPTTFRMTIVEGDLVGVSLEAWDNQGNPVTQFQVPLRLTLPYDEIDPNEIRNPSDLRLANIVSATDETILELVHVSVDKKSKTITGNIMHFSVWSVALELSKELSPGID